MLKVNTAEYHLNKQGKLSNHVKKHADNEVKFAYFVSLFFI